MKAITAISALLAATALSACSSSGGGNGDEGACEGFERFSGSSGTITCNGDAFDIVASGVAFRDLEDDCEGTCDVFEIVLADNCGTLLIPWSGIGVNSSGEITSLTMGTRQLDDVKAGTPVRVQIDGDSGLAVVTASEDQISCG